MDPAIKSVSDMAKLASTDAEMSNKTTDHPDDQRMVRGYLVIARAMTNNATLQDRVVRSGHCEFMIFRAKEKLPNGNTVWAKIPKTDIVATALPSAGPDSCYGLVKLTDLKVNTDRSRNVATIITLEKIILDAMKEMYHPQLTVVASETWFDRGRGMGSFGKEIEYMVNTHKLTLNGMHQAVIREQLQE